jgi:serine/threonine protein kinase
MDKYSLGKPLGEGAYGDVRIAYNNDTGDRVAIKTLKAKVKNIETFMLHPEVHALRSLSHPNLVRCNEFILDAHNSAHLVFELMTDGSLESLCRKRTAQFSEKDIAAIAYQILAAVDHVHSRRFMHRDVKPENILVSFPRTQCASNPGGSALPTVKLADFGLAKNIANVQSHRPNSGYVATRWYRAPEQLLRMHNGPPADIWAIGATLAELIRLGRPLFPGDDENDQLRLIFSIRGHPAIAGWEKGARAAARLAPHMARVTQPSLASILPDATPPLIQLIEALLQLNPTQRPTAAQAMQYPIFQLHPLHVNTASRTTTVNLSSHLRGAGDDDTTQYLRPGDDGVLRDAAPTRKHHVLQQKPQNYQQQPQHQPQPCPQQRHHPLQQWQHHASKEFTPTPRAPGNFFDIPSQNLDPAPVAASPRRLRSPAGFFNMMPSSGPGGLHWANGEVNNLQSRSYNFSVGNFESHAPQKPAHRIRNHK